MNRLPKLLLVFVLIHRVRVSSYVLRGHLKNEEYVSLFLFLFLGGVGNAFDLQFGLFGSSLANVLSYVSVYRFLFLGILVSDELLWEHDRNGAGIHLCLPTSKFTHPAMNRTYTEESSLTLSLLLHEL